MPINTPMVMEIDRKTWLIQEYGLDCCYALLGKRKGLLIDTGCGRMPIRALTQRLFEGRPYDVVLTHGHAHHCGGAKQFDIVHCGDDLPDITVEETPGRDFCAPKISITPRETEVLPLFTGDVFELGDREVLCIRTPGHSADSCSFYDRQSGIVFAGDAIGKVMQVECVSDALTGLMCLKRMAGGLSRIYPGHVDYMDCRALPAETLEDAIGVCQAALAPDGQTYRQEDRVRFRSVMLTYKQAWAIQEPCSPYPLGL